MMMTRFLRRGVAAAALALAVAPCAAATFVWNTPIAVPRPNNSIGEATTYPVLFDVAGLAGKITGVTLTLTGFTHSYVRDLNMVLSSPAKQNLTLMRVNGIGSGGVSDASVTFNDKGATQAYFSAIPSIATGWKPTGGTPINLLVPPAGTRISSFAGFNGYDPNGRWSFFLYDSQPGDDGTIRSISLNITTDALAAVPEPAGWATMLLGFALLGTTLRRGRRSTLGHA